MTLEDEREVMLRAAEAGLFCESWEDWETSRVEGLVVSNLHERVARIVGPLLGRPIEVADITHGTSKGPLWSVAFWTACREAHASWRISRRANPEGRQ